MKNCVDVWLHFGSFAYGIEGELVEANETSLVFLVSDSPLLSNQQDISHWLDALNQHSQALVHCEIRIFHPNDPSKRLIFFSNYLPTASPDNTSRLMISHLRPQTPEDAKLIKSLMLEGTPLHAP